MKPAPKKSTDPAILQEIVAHYSNPDVIARIKRAKIEKTELSAKDASRKNEILSELATIQKQIDNLLSSIADGNASLIKYANEKISELDNRKAVLNQELSHIDSLTSAQKSEADLANLIYDMLEYIPEVLSGGDFDKIKETCNILVREIRFKENGEIDVKCTI